MLNVGVPVGTHLRPNRSILGSFARAFFLFSKNFDRREVTKLKTSFGPSRGPLSCWHENARQEGRMDAKVQNHRENRLLAALAPKTLELLRCELRSISLNAGRTLYEPGGDIDQVYFPHGGLVSLLVVADDGQSVEIAIVGRDGAVGLQAGFGPRRSFTLAVTQIGGQFSVIRADRFAAIVQNDPTLCDVIVRYIEMHWAEAQQTAACNAVHEASARLCRWLLQCADRIGADEIELTQELLGQMLGVRRTTITLMAQSVHDRGYIRYRRGHIRILDREGLKKSSCPCYTVLQHTSS